ncbi:MAG: D-alanyl-D-alanine carboxypeptidase, partial [Clostridiales bacterium]|nr:D-alanyl-D-alanine carboxypeptidase [Clostridiales bacterium]
MKRRILGWLLVAVLALLVDSGAISVMAAVGRSDHQVFDYREAEDWPTAPEIDAESAFMIELNSGAVLYDKKGDESSYPASTTKIMTALLALENLEL